MLLAVAAAVLVCVPSVDASQIEQSELKVGDSGGGVVESCCWQLLNAPVAVVHTCRLCCCHAEAEI
jgi:hypothetical protein